MRLFINFFLIAFALDGLISVVDELTVIAFGVHGLAVIRTLVATAVIFLSLPVYISLGIDSRLPKRLLLPPVIFVVWAAFGCLPLFIYFDPSIVQPAVSLLQLVLAVVAFFMVKRISNGHWFLQPELFSGPVFKLKNTALFSVVNVVLIPVLVCVLLVSSVYSYLAYNTAGFMQLGTDGIYLQERSYVRNGQVIHLVAMVHIGSKEYYDELSDFLSSSDTVVLAEGVTDETGRIKSLPSYSKFADFIGLETQQTMQLHGKMIDYEQLGATDDDESKAENGATIVRADIDSKELSEDAVRFIGSVGEIFDNRSFAEGIASYIEWYSENMTPEKEKAVLDEIVNQRNDVLLRYLDEALVHHDRIVVPWGAMHMPGLEHAVLERGFTLDNQTRRLAIGFGSLLGSDNSKKTVAD